MGIRAPSGCVFASLPNVCLTFASVTSHVLSAS